MGPLSFLQIIDLPAINCSLPAEGKKKKLPKK